MEWVKVTVATTSEAADVISQILMDVGASGVEISDRNDFEANQRPQGQWDLFDESLLEGMGEDALVSAYYPEDASFRDKYADIDSRLREACELELPFALGKLTLEVKTVHEQDWAENWKKYYKPFRAGKSLVVKPSWEEYAEQPGDRVIEIDPGMAFGTGTHETTGMCVELVEKYVKPGDRVLDVGTGTGILAISAALMGAGEVIATDIDPVAVRVAGENIARNGLADRITAVQGDLLAAMDAQGIDSGWKCELASANIIADVIVLLSGAIGQRLCADGVFICSGIIRDRERDVLDALDAARFTVLEKKYRGEWVAICARR